jgi:hypothetical protein
MKKEEFQNIMNDVKDLKSLSNSALVVNMDSLSQEFELVKKNIIDSTFYLDQLEDLYNKTLSEYKTRGL